MRPNERHAAILEIVYERKNASVEYLAERFRASHETIRRDLSRLAADGRLRKYHGGATLSEAPAEGAFNARIHEFAREKRAVARRAAALFSAGDSLFIDTGTTTLALAQELARSSGLAIITNSVSITQCLARGPGSNRVFLIGGEYRAEACENLGPLAVAQVAQFNAHDAVLTVGAIGANGLQDYALEEAEIARAMIAGAERVTVIADASKLGRSALFPVCALERVARLVVSAPPQGLLAEKLAAAGVQVLVADAAPAPRGARAER
ncbi:DeoR/GlpR transcriptional regulator [Verminephrobacter aporrectodeae subsp. tuberculatae]|uniref:DeoR/GlpR transcriptional regulator n=2 Tax=Verminephrobacter TaxID=364316 RepID=A0ABT3KY58_9BURK|nr:DeoR/GlpR family DNA-binding transcription regulator [Verminephrobacter aporrectodeae]MCW5221638.1 DeoR/GlpR transcriptional regulator [Verminephrobacter aporrectodeae subsp. tuberculatae]MCW5290928.1 DeoR/GlpR transcriptional regulator [Verminephrobacter aporrectodeae subsp. tuberculatae]MCW5322912.1 DeoR/GlpR transcriptional regulator [Verminephrobacter aporrectodeae subsp. tuberculatae]MCW8198562.1 DeoR/GlpR transcriptional regulator [Verminephrobacter aporrectodeae subsp. tuberculatae]